MIYPRLRKGPRADKIVGVSADEHALVVGVDSGQLFGIERHLLLVWGGGKLAAGEKHPAAPPGADVRGARERSDVEEGGVDDGDGHSSRVDSGGAVRTPPGAGATKVGKRTVCMQERVCALTCTGAAWNSRWHM